MAVDRIRICYVLNRFELGGAETIALELARSHDPVRFDVEILAALEPPWGTEPDMLQRCRAAGVRTAMLRQRSYGEPAALLRLFSYLRRGEFDIVHGHNRGSDYWAARMGRWAGVPHRFWTRHLVYTDLKIKELRRIRSVSRYTDRIIAVSESVRESCIKTEGVAPDKVVTIVNGIDTARFSPLDVEARRRKRKELPVPDGDTILLFVGRFSEQKAPEAFIRLIWELRRRGMPVHGLMCGYGPLAAQLASTIRKGPGGVTVLGLRRDIPELLGSCDLFVSTSRNEGLPLNVMEAMSCGTPFVGPKIPQIKELVSDSPEHVAALFEPPPLIGPIAEGQIYSWASFVAAVLEDPKFLLASGQAGRRIIVRGFSLARMVQRYEELFIEALRRRRDGYA